MGIQVEVYVQDCYSAWNESSSEAAPVSSGALVGSGEGALATAIAAETWSDWFQRWLDLLQPYLSPISAYELGLRLTGDREIQTLNAQYRQQDNPTDVLAFAALETDLPAIVAPEILEPLYLGDIIISVQTAHRQAQTQRHSLTTELAWLASHGLLHLLGWDHPDDESLLQMLNKQQALLDTVGLLGEGS